MHARSRRERGLCRIDAAGLGVCGVATLLCYVLMIGPALRRQATAAEERGQTQTQQEKAAGLKDALAKVQEHLTTVRQEQAASATQLDSATHINRRIAGLTEYFSTCGLQVDDVQTGRISSNIRYDQVPITIVGRGAYRQCVKFFQGLCAIGPDMSVMRIDLTGNPVQPAEPQKFRLDLFWYTAPSNPRPQATSERPAGERKSRS